jgi:hypothetical protein
LQRVRFLGGSQRGEQHEDGGKPHHEIMLTGPYS